MKKEYFLIAVVAGLISSIFTVLASGTIPQFPDVNPDEYYATSIDRMVQLGVINGYEDGNFGPNDPVTRGQVATMLDRYDAMLLNTDPRGGASGVYDLITILCDEGLGNSLTDSNAQEAYTSLCSM